MDEEPDNIRMPRHISLSVSLCLSLRAGYLPQGVPLQLIGYLPEETSFLPWHAASRSLYQLDKLLDRTDEYSLFSVNNQSIISVSISHSVNQSTNESVSGSFQQNKLSLRR